MGRNIEFADGEFYHVYNRGTDKRTIFNTDRDRVRFLEGLYAANSTTKIHVSDSQGRTLTSLLEVEREDTLVNLCAYCLMPNHFHLLLQEKSAGGVSKFMQKLMTGYTMYFNIMNERTGSLLQGKYKAEHVNNDRYLKYLISYIHLNPIKLIEPRWDELGIKNRTRAEHYLERYRFSSFADYCGSDRIERRLINRGALPEYFETPQTFRSSVAEWLTFRKKSRSDLDF